MVIGINNVSAFYYSPFTRAQAGGPLQRTENETETGNGKIESIGPKECVTCNSRKYKDRSSDSSVSFQSPTSLSPEIAASAVRAHEQEHVSNNAADAEKQGLKATSTVSIQTDVCPECNRIYVSGGTTTTTYSSKKTLIGGGLEKNKGDLINTLA